MLTATTIALIRIVLDSKFFTEIEATMNKEKKFFEENSEGLLIYNPQCYDYIFGNLVMKIMETKEDYLEWSNIMFGSNINERKDLYGRQSFCTSDSSNRRLYCWKIELNNGIVWILSGGNGRGTTFECYSPNQTYLEIAKEFLEFMFITHNSNLVRFVR